MNIDLKIPEATAGKEDYCGEDGRLFCGICHEPKEAFFPVMGSPFDGKKHPVPCACERARREAEEAECKQREHNDTVMRLQQNCFPDGTHRNASIEDAVVQQDMKQVCSKYVEHWKEAMQNGTGLIFWGGVGTGKSYMAAAIANALIEREHSVEMHDLGFYLNCPFEERADRIGSASRPELLILDDLGMERDTSFGLETVFSVIDRRYRSGKPMIVTTNMTLGSMQKEEDLHYQRIFDRVLEVCIPLAFTGPSLRAAQRKEKVGKFRAMLLSND